MKRLVGCLAVSVLLGGWQGCGGAAEDPCAGHISNIVFKLPDGSIVNVKEQCIPYASTQSITFSMKPEESGGLIDFTLSGDIINQGTHRCEVQDTHGIPQVWTSVRDNNPTWASYLAGDTSAGNPDIAKATCLFNVNSPFSSGLLTGSFQGHLARRRPGGSSTQIDYLDVSLDINTKTNPADLNSN